MRPWLPGWICTATAASGARASTGPTKPPALFWRAAAARRATAAAAPTLFSWCPPPRSRSCVAPSSRTTCGTSPRPRPRPAPRWTRRGVATASLGPRARPVPTARTRRSRRTARRTSPSTTPDPLCSCPTSAAPTGTPARPHPTFPATTVTLWKLWSPTERRRRRAVVWGENLLRTARTKRPRPEESAAAPEPGNARAKSDVVGIYNENCDSDAAMDFAARSFTSDAGSEEEAASRPAAPLRASGGSEEAEARTDGKWPQREARERRPPRKVSKPAAAPAAGGKSQSVRTKQKPTEKKTKKKSVARRRKRTRSHTGPAALFPPREPEIKLKYANVKKEKKSKRVGSFCPFVHVRKKLCTVVNYEEEEEPVRTSGARRRKDPASPSGFVPGTSCFQLGRSGLDGGSPAAPPLCSLCGQTANAGGLGDLHGPYRPANPPADHRAGPSEGGRSPVSRRSANSSEDGCYGYDRPAVESPLPGAGRSPPRVHEGWIHEDCGVWSAGVSLVGGKLFGLEEAARLARETMCSACRQTGAITGCFQKGCARSYHYRCAIQSDCVLNEENFSLRCPEHKNKLLTLVTRQQKR
uniref:PHD-type domain-containing protein n=1 Tax=Gasterosteus aculeatus aculeatus TaxID=481459 RepID=A0AAQ4QDR5_GASAC